MIIAAVLVLVIGGGLGYGSGSAWARRPIRDNLGRVSFQTLLDLLDHNAGEQRAPTDAWRRLWLNSVGRRLGCGI
jgi:hypothetical protein